MLLVPSNVLNISNDKKHELLQDVTNHYACLDINILEFQGEIELWKTKWIESKNEYTEDSIVESQNTINESQPTSEIVTKNDALNSTLPSTSEGSNFCKPKQTATAERKNVQARRKRIRDEDRNFEREMMNMFKEYTKLMQTMTCHFFVRFCRL
ncbi:hypothetical protein QTP88_019800 [Uroleucon formosanum]